MFANSDIKPLDFGLHDSLPSRRVEKSRTVNQVGDNFELGDRLFELPKKGYGSVDGRECFVDFSLTRSADLVKSIFIICDYEKLIRCELLIDNYICISTITKENIHIFNNELKFFGGDFPQKNLPFNSFIIRAYFDRYGSAKNAKIFSLSTFVEKDEILPNSFMLNENFSSFQKFDIVNGGIVLPQDILVISRHLSYSKNNGNVRLTIPHNQTCPLFKSLEVDNLEGNYKVSLCCNDQILSTISKNFTGKKEDIEFFEDFCLDTSIIPYVEISIVIEPAYYEKLRFPKKLIAKVNFIPKLPSSYQIDGDKEKNRVYKVKTTDGTRYNFIYLSGSVGIF